MSQKDKLKIIAARIGEYEARLHKAEREGNVDEALLMKKAWYMAKAAFRKEERIYRREVFKK